MLRILSGRLGVQSSGVRVKGLHFGVMEWVTLLGNIASALGPLVEVLFDATKVLGLRKLAQNSERKAHGRSSTSFFLIS